MYVCNNNFVWIDCFCCLRSIKCASQLQITYWLTKLNVLFWNNLIRPSVIYFQHLYWLVFILKVKYYVNTALHTLQIQLIFTKFSNLLILFVKNVNNFQAFWLLVYIKVRKTWYSWYFLHILMIYKLKWINIHFSSMWVNIN